MKPNAVRRALLTVPCLVAAVAGCTSAPLSPLRLGREAEGPITREELATELNAFASRFAGVVATAGEEISFAHRDDPAIRRRAILWSVRMTPFVQAAAFEPNPRAGYVRILAITRMMQDYLTEGDGRSLFAESQPIAVSSAKTLHKAAIAIGERFLGPEQLEEVLVEVGNLAKRFPIQGSQFSLSRANEAMEEAEQSSALASIATLPLAPFRVFGSVDSGAAAIRNFNLTARRFSTVVAGLPESMRAEMELLLLDAEGLSSSRRAIAALEVAATSADRASLAMEGFVDELRAVLQQETRMLFEESNETLGRATQALGEARGLAGPLQASATEIREASALWREILGPHDPSPRDPESRPFDVREWERAAEAIGTAAAELRVLANELQGGPSLAPLDALFWRAVALVAIFFGLLLVYRVLAARLARPR